MGRLRKYIRPYYAYILLAVTIKLSGAVLELSGVSVAAWLPSTRSTVHPDRNRPSAIDTARVKAVIFFN